MTTYLDSDPIVISPGNNKVGKIPNVSLPPIISCVKGVPCATEKLCYSLKAWNAYPSVRHARLHNWNVWKREPSRYFSNLTDYLCENNPPYFRFHVDGDIPNKDYFKRMLQLCDGFPSTRFLAFTKHYDLPLGLCPYNLSVIPSAWPGLALPDNTTRIAWMEDGRENRYRSARFDCHGNCSECYACWHIYEIGKDVVLHKH